MSITFTSPHHSKHMFCHKYN